MIILHVKLLVCFSQILENGYYLSQNNRGDLLFAYNDTVLLKYPSICGNYIFKGTVNKKGSLEALYVKTNCSYFAYVDNKESSITKVIFSAYDGEARTQIISEALECKIQGFDKHNEVLFNKELKYEIIDSNYVCKVQDTFFAYAIINISIEGCFWDKVNFNISNNEIVKGEVYFFPYLKISPVQEIKLKTEEDKLILFYPKEISYPDIKCLFCGKEKVYFKKNDMELRLPGCLLKENGSIR